MISHPLTFEPFPPKMIGRDTLFYLGRYSGRHLVENKLKLAQITASQAQIEEIAKRLRGSHKNLDKGEMLISFYQIKTLLKDLRKGLSEEDLWRIVQQVTKKKPKMIKSAK